MASLYEMTEQANQLYYLLQSDEIDEQTFNNTLDAMGANEKIESYCKLIRQLQYDSDMYKLEIERLSNKKRRTDNSVSRMKNALLNFLIITGKDKTKAGIFNVSRSKSQSVLISDELKIPKEYLILQPNKIDKTGIKNALKNGLDIPGAEIITNEGVRIR